MPRTLLATCLLLVATSIGCQTYREDLARGRTAFEANQHERALAIFRMLEPDASHLTTPERAQYAYLRGMTDYRIGYRQDARHWLLTAQSLESETPGVLPGDWKQRMSESLTDLNNAVYTDGYDSLTNNRKNATAAAPKSADEP